VLVQLDAVRLGGRLEVLERGFNDLAHVRLFRVDASLAAHHAAHVEHVVDDLRQHPHVAYDGLCAAVGFLRG